MKQNILPAIKLSILLLVVFAVIYPLIIWVAAQATPNNGKGEVARVNGKVVSYANEGQNFTDAKYFWSRPSAVATMQQAAEVVIRVLIILIICR